MLTIALTLIIPSIYAIQIFTLSPESNPSGETLTFPIDNDLLDNDNKDYTLEFWMRPTVSSSVIVMEDNRDWQLILNPESSEMTLEDKDRSVLFCTFTGISSHWSHIAIAKSTDTQQFSCYVNATQAQSFQIASGRSRYADDLFVGGNFYGNIRELRFWLNVQRSQEDIKRYYKNTFDEDLSEDLHRYWKLVDETDELIDSANGRDVSIPNNWDLGELWKGEGLPPLMCGSSFYLSGNDCLSCDSRCEVCIGPSTTDCVATQLRLLDTTTASLKFTWTPTSPSTKTIEFWVLVNEWTAPSQPVMHFEPLFKLQRKDSSEFAVFLNSQGLEKLEFSPGLNRWVHIAFVRDGTSANIYIDGEEQFTGIWNNLEEEISTVYLGSSSDSNSFFSGIIREIRFWETSRTQLEVINFKDYSLTSPEGLIEYWKLTEGSSIRLSDEFGNNSISNSEIIQFWRPLDCTQEECFFLCELSRYLNDEYICAVCDPTCETCFGPENSQCLACSLSFPLSIQDSNFCYEECPGDYSFDPLIGFCELECSDGTFQSGQVCELCSPRCLTCDGGSETDCLSCEEESEYDEVEQTCTKICEEGQFTTGPSCLDCDVSCKNCDGSLPTDCLECDSAFLYQRQCFEECPEGTYPSDLVCLDCRTECLSCSGPELCDECSTNFPYRETNGECVTTCETYLIEDQDLCADFCPSNYFIDGDLCRLCNALCSECFGPNANECLNCPSVIFDNTCYEECPPNTYQDGDRCFSCDSSCRTCTGPLSTNCEECSSGFKVIDTSECVEECPSTYKTIVELAQCVLECPEGYFVKDEECLRCDDNCRGCEIESSNCTICYTGLLLYEGSCQETCPSSFFGLDSVCEPCHPNCQECDGLEAFNCTSCKPGLLEDLQTGECVQECKVGTFLLDEKCYVDCPDKYYEDISGNCNNCAGICATCNGNTYQDCLSCSNPLILQGSTCLTVCNDGFYPDDTDNTCKECDDLCAICSGSGLENCSVCKNGLVLSDANCLESCPEGSYLDEEICKECSINNCKLCTSNENCILCQDGFFFSSSSGICSDGCETGEIEYAETTDCVDFSFIYPTGEIQLSSFTGIQIEYPISIQKGIGYVVIYSGSAKIFERSISGNDVNIFQNSLVLNVPISVMAYKTEYYVIIPDDGIRASDGSSIVSFSTTDWTFRIAPYEFLPIVSTINGGVLGFEVELGKDYILDGSLSYDPSESQRSGSLIYAWDCLDFTIPYVSYRNSSDVSFADFVNNADPNDSRASCLNWDYSSPPTSSVVNVTNVYNFNNVLRYELNVQDSTGRQDISYVFVRITPLNSLIVNISDVPIQKINTEKPFFLKTESSESQSALEWDISPKGENVIFLTAPGPFLTVAEGSLEGGSSYNFILEYSDNQFKASSIIQIRTNIAPTDGSVLINLQEGVALEDRFIGEMINWEDEDLPLSYSFSFLVFEDTTKEFPITAVSPISYFNTFLPPGNLTIIGYVYDALGGRNSTTISVVCENSLNTIVIEEAANEIAYVIYDEQAVTSLAMASAVGIALNYTAAEDELRIKERLVAVVDASISAADSIWTDQSLDSIQREKTSAYIYYAVLAALEPITRQPFTETLVETVLNITSSLDIERLNIEDSSGQFLFTTQDIINLGQLLYETIDHVTEFKFIANIDKLIQLASNVLILNSQPTEEERKIASSNFGAISKRDFVSSFTGFEFLLNTGNSLTLRSLPESEEISVLSLVHIKNNPYDSSENYLQEYMSIEISNTDTSELEEPAILSFKVTRNTVEEFQAALTGSVWPTCVYWNTSEWTTKGCNLENISEIAEYFESTIPESFDIKCACYHLSVFSIRFDTTQQAKEFSVIIKSEIEDDFSLYYKETAMVLYILAGHLVLFVAAFLLANIWDKQHPGMANPSEFSERNYGYCDRGKVDSVIKHLERDLIQQAIQNSKNNNTNDPTAYLSKIASSALLKKIKQSSIKKKTGNLPLEDFSVKHPIEDLLEDYTEDFSTDESMIGNISNYLNKGVEDPRFFASFMNQSPLTSIYSPSKTDLEFTISSLKLHLHHMENNTYMASPIDQFLEKYDSSKSMPSNLQTKLTEQDRPLRRNDLKGLGYGLSEFEALGCDKKQRVIGDTKLLTGGKYCKV